MGTFVTDTDKIISKMKFIISFICIINNKMAAISLWKTISKSSYFHSQMSYLHEQQFV